MSLLPILKTGQNKCYNSLGHEIPCPGSGQDAKGEYGIPWPEPRFHVDGDVVFEELTGLYWTRNANINEFPMTWQEGLSFVTKMNREKTFGFNDWRLPNRRELRSLMSYQERKPTLPENHPFTNVFLGWYWTSTTAAINPAYAWYVHMEGARMFYGRKDQSYLLWPTRGKGHNNLIRTGQIHCYDDTGSLIDCDGTGQDAEYRFGLEWPEPSFVVDKGIVHDQLTNIFWLQEADITHRQVGWDEALASIQRLNEKHFKGIVNWRLPNINELESLVDCSQHSPALPVNHPFINRQDTYWSSTTSVFAPDWAWALYLAKGALGVGHKPGETFYVWPVYKNFRP